MREAREPQPETRERILQAAAEVFAERGFESATLKEITARAEANIAAVNYYFRAKDELIRQVVSALLERVNAARDAALASYEARETKGDKPALAELIEALIRPMVEVSRNDPAGRSYVSLLMQARFSPAAPDNLHPEADGLHERFIAALSRQLPQLSRQEIIWRYENARGAMIYTMAGMNPKIHHIVRLSDAGEGSDVDRMIRDLVGFSIGGFMAPSTQA